MNSNDQIPQTTLPSPAMYSSKKRPATNMSSDSSQSSSVYDSSHEQHDQIEAIHGNDSVRQNHSPPLATYDFETKFQHFIKQTFLGPICTRCQRKVANGNILFDVSRNSIKNHMTTNKCFRGNISLFKPKELEIKLRQSMVQLHTSIANNPTLASRLVRDKNHFIPATKNLPYCDGCGFIGTKLCHVRSHVHSKTTKCTESDIRSADKTIMMNEYGFLIPKSVLERICDGKFVFTIKHKKQQTTHSVSVPPSQDNPTITRPLPTEQQSPIQHANTHVNQSSILTVHPSCPIFLPSDDDIALTLSNNSPYNDAVTLHSFAISELANTFQTKEMADTAYNYLTCYALLLNQNTPGSLKNTLFDYSTMMTKSDTNSNLKLLLYSGKRWLESDAANMDVCMVPVHHRNNIYQIGNTHTDNDNDLLRGGTFVWSENVSSIVTQFLSLIKFAYEIKWPQITPFLTKVQDIYIMSLEDPSNNNEDEYDLASVKLVNTNIIFCILIEILLEKPSIPNGPNIVYKYLAGCTARKHQSGEIILRNPNEISKNANSLLRLFRHAICSMYIRQSQIMVLRQESHKTFEVWANNIIEQVQQSYSIGHICRTIRTAREVDRKTPSFVKKAFNDVTGELLVAGHQIHKSTWSIAIPSAVSEWDKHLTSFFPNHSSTSNLPLHWIFDLDNELVLAGNESYLSIAGQNDQTIPLTEYNPILPQ